MARAGSGNFYFIQSAQQIPDLLASELGEALEVVARGATLEVALPHGATAKALQGFRHFFAAGDRELRIELGDLVSGQQVDVVIAIELDRGVEGAGTSVDVTLTSRDTIPVRAEQRWTYASHSANDREARNRDVDRKVASLYAARARAEAAELNRAGHYEHARRVLERTARKIRSYAGTDRELNALADELLAERDSFAAPMSPMEMKQRFFAASAVMAERAPSGRAKR